MVYPSKTRENSKEEESPNRYHVKKSKSYARRTGKLQEIIDYPRHIRVSSEFESVAEVQSQLRKQRVYLHEFDSNLTNTKNLKILEGVYVPNEPVGKEYNEMYVNEFIRLRGNFSKGEPRDETIV